LKHFTAPEFWDAYNKLPSTVRRQADSAFAKMKADPYHPSVHLKRVGRHWSARVGLHYRAIAIRTDDDFVWFWIGTHSGYNQLVS
jgi:hypothetical protein